MQNLQLNVEPMSNGLLDQVMNLDLTKVKTRLVKNQVKEETAETAVQEFKRFFFLAGTQNLALVPSRAIDEVWHEFLMFTKDYAESCERLFGKFIHHEPSIGNLDEDSLQLDKVFSMTAKLYKNHFGDEYVDIPLRADCCNGDNGCHTCSGQTCCSTP